MDPSTLGNIAKTCSYQYICGGKPIWSDTIVLPPGLIVEEIFRNRIDQECEQIRASINQRVALATLSFAFYNSAHLARKKKAARIVETEVKTVKGSFICINKGCISVKFACNIYSQ